ncbi:MAG: hypothetical protein DWQ05_05520 [Calditrichaeota bacterium]|nr:MAG: hypothetical protein DWQ05_05520 [Calditrichota bacterium]
MYCTKIFLFCTLLLFVLQTLAGQSLMQILDEVETENAIDIETLIRSYIPSPIPLKKISPDSVSQLWFLTALQMKQLKAVLQTQSLQTLTYPTLAKTLNMPIEQVELIFELPDDFFDRLSHRARFKNNQNGTCKEQKFEFTRNNTTARVTLEQDAGEKQLNDFSSAYLGVNYFEKNLSVVLGDFTVQSATGLVYAGPFSAPILSHPRTAAKFHSTKIRPYRSITENLAFRGLALNLNKKRFQVLSFYSSAKRDAQVNESGFVVSRPISGLHVSEAEQGKKDALGENTTGIFAELKRIKNFQLGTSLTHTRYSYKIIPADLERQHFHFNGEWKSTWSLYSQFVIPPADMVFFSEIGRLNNGAHAEIVGFKKSAAQKTLSILLWQATPDFESDYGTLPNKQLGETSNTSGFYFGFYLGNHWGKFIFSIQREKTPWRTYLFPQPVEKQTFIFHFEKRLLRKLNFNSRLKVSTRPQIAEILPNTLQLRGNIINNPSTSSIYLKTDYQISSNCDYRFRFDFARTSKTVPNSYQGWAQMHQFKFRFLDKYRFQIRYSLFTIEDYLSRIYQIDYRFPDLLQPIPLSGLGRRFILGYQFKIFYIKLAGYFIREKKQDEQAENQWGVQFNFSK